MNPDLNALQPYPFEKLNALFDGIEVADKPRIALSIGEPKHQPPGFVLDALQASMGKVANYPATKGIPALRDAIAAWACSRFQLPALCANSQVLPVNGTREALFSFTQAVIDRSKKPLVISPNPFYQIYEGAAFLAGAELKLLDCTEERGFIPNFDSLSAADWDRCQLLFLCSPGNPTGAVIDIDTLQKLIQLAEQHDFIIAADECYSEIYFDESKPPVGLLQAAAAMGNTAFKHCVVFHSLSKRSNLPGLRSGFVAGDAEVLKAYLAYRTYHGCALPLQHQEASIVAWQDEDHVRQNREYYRAKYTGFIDILGGCLDVSIPEASFYLWPKTPISETEFARRLYQEENLVVLPGSYLGRDNQSENQGGNTGTAANPGANRVRMALVAEIEECLEAAQRIKDFVRRLESEA